MSSMKIACKVCEIKHEDIMTVSSDKDLGNKFSHIFKEETIEKCISLISLYIVSCSNAPMK